MADQRAAAAASREDSLSGQTFAVSAPQVSLLKGGGAIRGIGEKFGAQSRLDLANTQIVVRSPAT